jgi:hypothetical protein
MALLGGGAELAVAVIGFAWAGPRGGVGAAVGGAIAVAAQFVAVALLRPAMRSGMPAFVRRWASGIAIRAASALVLVGVAVATRAVLPPVGMALGFFAVLLTLLYSETRFLA